MDFPDKIDGQRISLQRVIKPTFALGEEIYAAINESREHLMPFLPWAMHTNSSEDEFFTLKQFEQNFENGHSFAYIIRNKDTQFFLGFIDVIGVDLKHKSAEMGFWLQKNACGQGYMIEAVHLLEKEIFKQGFHRIVIQNDTRNIKSANVAQNSGYRLDGIMRGDRWSEQDNCFVDTNIWSKLKSDYED